MMVIEPRVIKLDEQEVVGVAETVNQLIRPKVHLRSRNMKDVVALQVLGLEDASLTQDDVGNILADLHIDVDILRFVDLIHTFNHVLHAVDLAVLLEVNRIDEPIEGGSIEMILLDLLNVVADVDKLQVIHELSLL